ncbi:uncharacterized protein LOC114530260 [Dendronephthya gigantea]|uniref:uncharacterized protein LOC114530260 n=1 Tax=Dendronephthya gigantea TaxID=151771 RepID=UPI00106D82BB|nr:uncharacterized protein LOC114530260 [Dendronephthya gigantea]
MVVAKGKSEPPKLHETLFEEFVQAADSVDILLTFHKLKAAIGAENVDNGRELYGILKSKLQSWKCKSLWDVLDARAKHKEYGNQKTCEDMQVLVIGSGPIGLRTAIEVALLGAKVIIVEKRTTFSRNNVLHLWPFLIHDFRSLGAKRFYGKFCSGSLDHIGIRMLQCLLMKAALILGVQIYTGVTFEKVIEPMSECGWRCQVDPPFHPASQFDLDMVVGADGKRNVLPDFPQIEMRGSLAIGITLNLVYHGTKQEAAIPEISGLAYHFKPKFFDDLYQKSGVRLENFVYYKGETHYFVMTAVKSSLLARGALIMDYPKPADLLASPNVNYDRLKEYALDAVKFGTEGKLTDIEFVQNDRGKSDIAVFDFTSLKKAEHAARIVERKGHRLLLALVGDSLIEPFWPTGSGCARGVLSALDTAWMLRSFAMDRPPLQVLSERENIYKLLSATTVDNLRKKFEAYTINPFSRYIDLNLKRVKEVYHLYDSDDPVNADFRVGSPTGVASIFENTKRRISVGGIKAAKTGRRRKSSSDDLDEKRGRIRSRKSSSDDLDDKKGKNETKSRKKSIKQALRRSHSRDTDNELNDVTPNSKTKSRKSVKKQRSQSSESADEKEVRRKKKLGRTKSRDTDGSNNSLDTITESPQTVAKKKENAENKHNSVLMKQRSTKRWRLFGGTKPKLRSVDKDSKSASNENLAGRKEEDVKKLKRDVEAQPLKNGQVKNEVKEKEAPKKQVEKTASDSHVRKGMPGKQEEKTLSQTNDHRKNGLGRSISKETNTDRKARAGGALITETYTKSTLRQLNSHEASPQLLRNSLRKTSELRGGSISNTAATPARLGQVKRTNSDIKRTDRVFTSLRQAREEKRLGQTKDEPVSAREATEQTGVEKEHKRAKLDMKTGKESVSVFDDIKSLSPAAQRTAPLLKTLTPEKKDGKYNDGGAIAAAAGLAAMLALTTPLAMEGQKVLERQKILTNSQVSVKEKIAFLNSVSNYTNKTRRDLTSALDGADGSPKPVKRFSSFSNVQRNVKQKLEEDSNKALTLPRKVFPRQSLQEKMFSAHADIPSALDSAINILIKSYTFDERLQGTLKIMLNIFRCISKDPDDETPRRISTNGQLFRPLVWDLNEAKLFMVVSGWMEIGSFIVFPKTKTVHEPIRVLMQNYRQLWEKQALDTSCPQFVLPESTIKHRRRPSDDVFQKEGGLPRDDGLDTGSHSGSDSGMGFSETASEHNVPAVMAIDDVAHDVITDDVTTKRSSKALDPRMYLEASYNHDLGEQKLNPSDYVEQSIVDGPDQSTTDVQIPDNTELYPNKPLSPHVHPSKILKKHDWEIMEEPTPALQSPKGILYAPSLQAETSRAKEKRSSFRHSRQLASELDVMMNELQDPINEDPDVLDTDAPLLDHDPQKHHSNDGEQSRFSGSEVSTIAESRGSKTSSKQQAQGKRNELDDLFETLDFVSDALTAPRVIYEEQPKKTQGGPKSTEASRRREEYTRSKLQSKSTEESALRSNCKTRSQVSKERQHRGGALVENNGQHTRVKDSKTRSKQAISEVDSKQMNDTRQRRNNAADESTNEPLRRSRRIAESSNRKAVLVLDASGYPEESSTDLNQAFVDSELHETKQESGLENGSLVQEKSAGRKKKARRQSSVVKASKSRARAKRTGYKSRKERSIDT